MKRCLCCGEVIDEKSIHESTMGWHDKCVRSFFGTNVLPQLKVDENELAKLVEVSAANRATVPGVQKKISLHLERDTPVRLTLVNYPTGYIMKPQTDDYDNLPEYEWLAMKLARVAGVKTVPFALYDTGEQLVYLTKRIDRKFIDDTTIRYAMEDFCQLSERLAEDKYKGSYELCARVVREYSEVPGVDAAEMFLRIAVSYVVGNSDLHLKNFSLIENESGGRIFGLSSAYDILPVNVVEPEDLDEMALSLNGKKRGLDKEDFLKFAEYCGIGQMVGEKMMAKLCEKKEEFEGAVKASFLDERQKEDIVELMKKRFLVLTADR